MQPDGDLELHCATVMPDHAHLLTTLGRRLHLGQAVAKWKRLPRLREHGTELVWQENFYDHRLRAEASLEAFSRYIYLNPYRKRLVDRRQQWPWWVCHRDDKPGFTRHLENGLGPPEHWIADSPTVQELIDADIEEA